MKFPNYTFLLVLLSLVPFSSLSQNDNEHFKLALAKHQSKMNMIDSLLINMNSDSLLKLISDDKDTIYYCDFSNSKPLGELTSLNLSSKTIINVNQNWLDSNRIYLFGLNKYETPNDSLNLLLLYYQTDYEGFNWVKYSKKPSTERLDHSNTKKLLKHDAPLFIGLEYNNSRINITNHLYGLPAEIYYRKEADNFDSFSFTTELRRLKFLKSYTFIRLDENVTVRIIHKGSRILNYKVKNSQEENFNDLPKLKPTRKLKRLY